VNPVVDLFVVWKVQAIEGLHRTEGGGLRADPYADEHRLHDMRSRRGFLQIPDGNLTLALKHLMDVVLTAAR